MNIIFVYHLQKANRICQTCEHVRENSGRLKVERPDGVLIKVKGCEVVAVIFGEQRSVQVMSLFDYD